MKIYTFPYRVHRGVALPLVPIVLEEKEIVYALVDSEVTISLFEFWVGERFGIQIEKGN